MKKRTIFRVKVEPASSSNIQLDFQDETKYTATISVACAGAVMYRIDEPVFIEVLFAQYANISAHFIPDGSDMLTIRVSEDHIKLANGDSLSGILLNKCLHYFDVPRGLCGGILHIFWGYATERHSFQIVIVRMLNALLADWLYGTDEEIQAVIRDG